MFPPQPNSLKSFPTSRERCFTKIPLAPFPELPCWRATQSHQVPGEFQRPPLASFPLPWHISHHLKSYHLLHGTPGTPTLPVSSRIHPPPAVGSVGCRKHRRGLGWVWGMASPAGAATVAQRRHNSDIIQGCGWGYRPPVALPALELSLGRSGHKCQATGSCSSSAGSA